MREGFRGWYYKHQKVEQMLALIPGRSAEQAFLQVLTNKQSFVVPYERRALRVEGGTVRLGESFFSSKGICLDVRHPDIRLSGEIAYSDITPIAYDIMGPFRYLPMQCRHGVISMRHGLRGALQVNGETLDFGGGMGYIEMDSGASFPKHYAWVQCNDFKQPCSIMVSVAHIPFVGFHFLGCICVVWLAGREYRLATYRGVKVICNERGHMVLAQGKYRLEVIVPEAGGHALFAPDRGQMKRVIHEAGSCKASFRFFEGSQLLFHEESAHASYEFAP